jgi:hypothetical protein
LLSLLEHTRERANPTEGYGIFIENMLNAAQNQAQPKAA